MTGCGRFLPVEDRRSDAGCPIKSGLRQINALHGPLVVGGWRQTLDRHRRIASAENPTIMRGAAETNAANAITTHARTHVGLFIVPPFVGRAASGSEMESLRVGDGVVAYVVAQFEGILADRATTILRPKLYPR